MLKMPQSIDSGMAKKLLSTAGSRTVSSLMAILSGLAIASASVTYEHAYEADILPDEVKTENWLRSIDAKTEPTSNRSIAVIDGKLLVKTFWVTKKPPYENIAWSVGTVKNRKGNAGWKYDDTKGSTIDFRVRITSHQRSGPFGVQIGDGSNLWDFLFRTNDISDGVTKQARRVKIDNTTFHTFRIAVKGDKVSLYVAGESTPLFDQIPAMRTYARNALAFGDYGSGGAGSFELDFIRWTNSEAVFAPPSQTGSGNPVKLQKKTLREDTKASEVLVKLEVSTGRIAYNPGALVKVSVSSSADMKLSGRLLLTIRYDLDGRDVILDRQVKVEPGRKAGFKATWKSPVEDMWGCEVRAEILDEKNNRITMNRQVFVVSDNLPESSAHYAIISRHVYGWPAAARLNAVFDFFVGHAVPIVEMYCWTPSNWGVVMPEREEWLCGQMRLKMTTQDITGVVEHAHRRGMLILTYGRIAFDGIAGYRYVKAHPEDVLYRTPAGGYNPAVAEEQLPGEIFDSSPPLKLKPMTGKEIRAWEKFEANLEKFSIAEARKQLCRWEMLVNCSRNETLDQGLDQYIAILKRFKFDGIRWDGHPRQYYHPIADMWMRFSTGGRISNTKYDWQGRPVTPDDPDQENLRIYRRFSQRLRAAIPDTLLGYNIQAWNRAKPDTPELTSANMWPATFAELLKDAIVLDEKHFLYKPDGRLNMHKNWTKTIKFLSRGNEMLQKHGAFHYVGGMPSKGAHPFFLHIHSLCYAIGARPFAVALPYGKYPPQYKDFMLFAQRYAKYLFHRNRTRIFSENMQDSIHFKVLCDRPVIYRPFSYHLSTGGKYTMIVNLWNQPVKDEMNLLQCEEPPMVKDTQITFRSVRGLPRTKAEVYVLSPEWPNDDYGGKITVDTSKSSFEIKIPPFRYWAVVFLQYPFEPLPPKTKKR